MINNDKVHHCACNVRGLRHAFTADTTGKHILMTDRENAHLLQNAGWCVSPVYRDKPSKLHARATSRAPYIRKNRTLHRLASTVKNEKKRVRAINGNLLDARKANLQIISHSDQAIMNRAEPVTKLVGVHYAVPPLWLKTECHYHSSISIDAKKLHLGSFKTLEEAGAAFDAATIKVNGGTATTNQSLGFISTRVAKTKACRRAAKAARNRVREHQSKALVAKIEALKNATTPQEKAAIFRSMSSVPSARVATYA